LNIISFSRPSFSPTWKKIKIHIEKEEEEEESFVGCDISSNAISAKTSGQKRN
jgi:hypothetical protein